MRRARDPRLDAFRGLGLCIILVAHIPWNPWASFIPARYGFSDAAELFVFCSGLACALAFGRTFDERGIAAGTLRITRRMAQVHLCHILVFLGVLALMALADRLAGADHYVREELRAQAFLHEPGLRLVRLAALAWVPENFDILPMYVAVLAMVPLAMALSRIHPGLVAIASLLSWGLANAGLLALTADGATGRTWFFNPFAWQLVFFTGFAFGRGWLKPPRAGVTLAAAAALLVLASAPFGCQGGFACHAGFGTFPLLGHVHDWLGWWIAKPTMGPLRYLHFLATAYLAFVAAGPGGVRLQGPVVRMLQRIGRQSLPVFLASLVAAQLCGVVMDFAGRGFAVTTLVNLAGIASLSAVAFLSERSKRRLKGTAGDDAGGHARRALLPRSTVPAG